MNPDLIDWSLNDLSQDDPLLIKLLQEKYLIEPNKRAFNLTIPMTASLLKGQFGQPHELDKQFFRYLPNKFSVLNHDFYCYFVSPNVI